MADTPGGHFPKVRRLEDEPLITGAGRYVDDLQFSQPPLYMGLVRSVHAHALIRAIRFEAALALPGVVGAWGADELKVEKTFKPLGWLPAPQARPTPRYPLAVGKTRFVGDPVAVVVATDRYILRDALDLIEVDYEPLPAVASIEAATKKDAPLLYEDWGTNGAYLYRQQAGDIEAAFARAAQVVSVRLEHPRVAPLSIEGRAIAADYDPHADFLTVWMSTQGVYRIRDQLCDVLGLDADRVRVIAADCGGAFGIKGRFSCEEALVCYLARRLARPVKWVESRSENLAATSHGRGQLHELELAVSKDGELLGLRGRIVADVGAYFNNLNTFMPFRSSMMLPGVYRLGAIDVAVTGVMTNKVPLFSYRGAGRPEPAYSIERLVEAAAHGLGLDPVELRRRNFIKPGGFPYKSLTGLDYDSGDYPALLETVLKAGDYEGWRRQQREQPTLGLGIGLATFIEVAAGPLAGLSGEQMEARLGADGRIELLSGSTTNGQGHATTQARIMAERLGLQMADVRVKLGDTNLAVHSVGTFASRSTALSGSAVLLAATALREKIIEAAAELLEAAPTDLELADGTIAVRGVPTRRLSLTELAATTGELRAIGSFQPKAATYPSGAHLAVVRLDQDTGEVEILKYVAVDDAGNIIVPALAEGQVAGSLAQGIAQALYEEIVYDENGQLLSGTLMDYAVPTAEMIPNVETLFQPTPSPTNPLGAKGIGESGCIGGPPAIVNAVLDALRHLGIAADEADLNMPLKPEKIWQLLHQ